MSTYTSEPGTRLAGRYRLVDQVNQGAGWTFWKATDEALARSITVLTFAPGFPRVTETVTAARAVSRLGDPRFSQVFDVEDAGGQAYVVLEWVAGESLLDMLTEGPLDPPRAAALVTEAARAIAGAHAAGLAHLRLDPACVHWTAGGGVKIVGLGIDAALAGLVPEALAGADDEDPELTDTRDLARLLYAALTGYWPGQPEPAGVSGPTPGLLPPAPEDDGIPCTPRQVSAGVPAGVDDVTCRALFQRPSRHGPALSAAAMFADALASAAPPLPLPFSPVTGPGLPPGQTQRIMADGQGARNTGAGYAYHPDGSTSPYPQPDGRPRTRARGGRGTSGRHSPAARIVVSAVIALVLAAVGVAAWTASHGLHNPVTTTPAKLSPSTPAAAAAVQLKPVRASSFDPFGSSGSGGEDPAGTQFAIDSDPATAWHTSYYLGSPIFGNLGKKGTGLLLDMGRQVRLSQLMINFGPACCTHVEIGIGNDSTPSAATLSTFTQLQSSTTAAGDTTFTVTKQATGRYVLIWITELPPLEGSQGKYEAFIYNVVVRGFAAGQPG